VINPFDKLASLLAWLRDRFGRERRIEDLADDPIDIEEFMFGLKRDFGISMPALEAERIKTVGDAIRYLERIDGMAQPE
jgi:acyl carrier protein